jgi:hypothetical protein
MESENEIQSVNERLKRVANEIRAMANTMDENPFTRIAYRKQIQSAREDALFIDNVASKYFFLNE